MLHCFYAAIFEVNRHITLTKHHILLFYLYVLYYVQTLLIHLLSELRIGFLDYLTVDGHRGCRSERRRVDNELIVGLQLSETKYGKINMNALSSTVTYKPRNSPFS